MLFGSKAKPMFLALGTAAILAAAPVVAVDTLAAADTTPPTGTGPTPDPSSPPATTPPATTAPATTPPVSTPPATTPPAPTPPSTANTAGKPKTPSPSLAVRLALSMTVAAPGDTVTVTAWVSAQSTVAHNAILRLSAPGAEVGGPRRLGDLGSGVRAVSSLVKIPTGHAAGTITVTASIRADRAATRTSLLTITVTSAAGTTLPGTTLPANLSAPGAPPPGMPPLPSRPTAAQLPLTASSPDVAAAASTASGMEAKLHNASSVLGFDDSSYRLICTDVAWLTALLVSMSLLGTQLRLNRHAARRGKATAGRGR